jgi:hypothetical protein
LFDWPPLQGSGGLHAAGRRLGLELKRAVGAEANWLDSTYFRSIAARGGKLVEVQRDVGSDETASRYYAMADVTLNSIRATLLSKANNTSRR